MSSRGAIMNLPVLRATLLAVAITASWGPTTYADDSLYRSFGERDGLVRIIDDATNRWVSDDRTKDTFDDINLDRFKRMLVDQLCELTGGPCHYKGRDMYHAHKGLHLDNAQFNALVEDLQLAMDKYDIPFRTQNRLLAILAPMEHDVVTR
jgi:hemoglobin